MLLKPELNKIVNQIETQINTIIQQICPLHEQAHLLMFVS